MTTLQQKIDFAVVFRVTNANPNGDPLNGNRPRITYDGLGELTDVCLKRKIRNRLMEAGKPIFVQSDDNKVDKHPNLKSRAGAVLSEKTVEGIINKACSTWFDVRAFGQLFPFKGEGGRKGKGKEVDEAAGDDKGVSIGIRGPVSVQSAFSVTPVSDCITSNQITKSTSNEGDGIKRQPDQMGMKHRVDRGTYVFFGSMNPQLAEKTGFSDTDAQAIKQVFPKLFENDASSARPEGSMEVLKVIWWQHNSKAGQYSSAKVHRTLTVKPDGSIDLGSLNGLPPEIIDGF
jgi:CRISPR-associated protein Csd2